MDLKQQDMKLAHNSRGEWWIVIPCGAHDEPIQRLQATTHERAILEAKRYGL